MTKGVGLQKSLLVSVSQHEVFTLLECHISQGYSLHCFKRRPGKSCESSSSGKFRALECPQNSRIRDEG